MKLCLSTWSLRSQINRDFPFHEFPKVAKERYGIEAVELCQQHFPPPDSRRLDQLLEVVTANGSTITNIPVDVGNISQRDAAKRAYDVKLIKSWVDVAAYIGAPSIRVNTGRQDGEPDLSITVASYNEIADYAAPKGIRIGLENHGGLSADPANIVKLVEAVGAKRFGTLPDFGNFSPEDRYRALEMIVPYALIVHAKTLDFDENGHMPQFDFARCLEIVHKGGYDGYLSIEFEGKGDQYDGVAKSIALIRTLEPGIS